MNVEIDTDICISVSLDHGDAEICFSVPDFGGNFRFLPLRELVTELLDKNEDGSVEDLPGIARAFRMAADRLDAAK